MILVVRRIDYLTLKERKVINKSILQLKEEFGNDLILIRLYGSKVRGDFDKESDIDILIVAKQNRLAIKKKVFDILFNIDPYYECKISPVILSEYDYRKNRELQTPFVESIEKEGINL